MGFKYKDGCINILRDNLDIVAIIGTYTKLHEIQPTEFNKNTHLGLCPIPQCEANGAPTLYVNSNERVWSCGSCRGYINHYDQEKEHKGGNVIHFVGFVRGCQFMKAYSYLCIKYYDQAGHLVKEYQKQNSNTPSNERYYPPEGEDYESGYDEFYREIDRIKEVVPTQQSLPLSNNNVGNVTPEKSGSKTKRGLDSGRKIQGIDKAKMCCHIYEHDMSLRDAEKKYNIDYSTIGNWFEPFNLFLNTHFKVTKE